MDKRMEQTTTVNYVVIPMKDRADLTRPLLRDLKKQGNYEKIFIFDNGSARPTRKWLSTQQTATVVDAKGWNIHEMWNRGLDLAGEGNIALLNNDIKIGPNFLKGLATGLRSDSKLDVVCPNYDGREGEGICYVNQIAANLRDGAGGLAGFAFMMRGEWGYRFPEELKWWYGDNHMVAHARHAGIVLNTTVEHRLGGSLTAGDWNSPYWKPILLADGVWWQAWVKDQVAQ